MEPISVLLPTKGRYEALQNSIISLSKTEGAKQIELIVVSDADIISHSVAKTTLAEVGNKFGDYLTLHSIERLYPIKAFNKALANSQTDLFCWMNDENTYEPNWLIKNQKIFFDSFPDGIGLLSLYKKKKAGLGMTTKRFRKYNHGEWFNPIYRLYYADDELTARAILLGRYNWSENSGVFHDDSITKSVSAISWEEKIAIKKIDRGIFYKRSENNFGLNDDEIYKWEGFRLLSEQLKRKE